MMYDSTATIDAIVHVQTFNGTPYGRDPIVIVYMRAPAPTMTASEAVHAFSGEVRDYLDRPPNPGMTRSAWHRESRAPSPLVLGCARSQECRPFVPRAPVERRHRSSLRRFVA
jgi:hypothetical protein